MAHFFFFYQNAAVPHTHAGRGAEHVDTCAESPLSSASAANPVSRAGVQCRQGEGEGEGGQEGGEVLGQSILEEIG